MGEMRSAPFHVGAHGPQSRRFARVEPRDDVRVDVDHFVRAHGMRPFHSEDQSMCTRSSGSPATVAGRRSI